MSEESGFISRWAERKRRVQDESQKMAAEAKEAATSEPQAADEFEGKTDDEILMELELPAPESLKLGDSVAGFMDARVPERIRHRALRAFWKTNPVLANIDGLDEYCEDFTDAATVIENLETIYQVGKGYASQALDALEAMAEADDHDAGEALQLTETQDHRIDHLSDQHGQEASNLTQPEQIASADDETTGDAPSPSEQPEQLEEPPVASPILGRRMQFRS